MPSGTLRCLPFSAIKGMDDVKKALECIATDDDILAILIKGPTGTAKSVIARSFASLLSDKEMISIPQNISDEHLFGGLDIEDAVITGRTTMKNGILQRADGNILYIDNANLFDPRVLSSILSCAESGKVIIEREGISSEYELKTKVIATMDPAEQPLPDALADRFDICVQSGPVFDADERNALIRTNLEFDADPIGIREQYSHQDRKITEQIERARCIIKDVVITRSDLDTISQVCLDLDVKGHRADISIARVARTIAALDSRTSVSDDDIKEAAVMCLLHRRGTPETDTTDDDNDEEREKERKKLLEETDIFKEVEQPDDVLERTVDLDIIETTTDPPAGMGSEDSGTVAEIVGSVKEKLDDMDKIEAIRLRSITGAGRRKSSIVKRRTGRYRGFRIPKGRTTDPAFDATVRAAAPYQLSRPDRGLSISIESQDIREKIRMKKDSCSFLFAVDVSGSLVDTGMMYDIKNGVRAMLMDSYVQRDKVALLTFRTHAVRISVPFTRSVERICEALDNTETGGGTPLGEALLMIRDHLLNYIKKNPEERCFVILMTDGDATDPVVRGDPSRELKKIADFMKIPNTEWVVVDSAFNIGRVNYAMRLANLLGAGYIRLTDLQSSGNIEE